MAIRVKTYLDPCKWSDREYDYSELVNSVHICATKKVCNGIQDTYEEFHRPIVTFAEVRDKVFGFWFSHEMRLQLQLEVSRYLNDCQSMFSGNHYQYVHKNLRELLDTILELRFIGVCPMYFEGIDLGGKEKAMLTLWESCVLKSDIYEWQCGKLDKILKNPLLIKAPMRDILKIDITRDSIVLQGYYFITPEQQTILKCIERAGASLTFFNLYDDRYESTFSFVKKFINEENGWTNNWQMESKVGYPEKSMGADFLQLFEGIKVDKKPISKTVLEYPDFNVFLQQVIMPVRELNPDERPAIVSTSADILNGILDMYFPERKGSNIEAFNNYLKYPIGNFLVNIHNVYKPGDYKLDFMGAVDLFASGFLDGETPVPNANTLVKQLYDVKTYCENCKTIDQWERRLTQLKEFHNEVLSKFPVDDTRMGNASTHPFKRLSYANVTVKQIEYILFHLSTIKKIVSYLFGKGEMTNINSHFQKVRKIIEKLLKVKSITKDDVEMIKRLSESISKIDREIPCLYNDIGEALVYYLSGKDKENESAQIIPFIEVDGLAFKGKGNISKYYITGLDEGGLPLGKYDMPYPLSESTVNELGKYNKNICFLLYRNESIKQISRYLLYIVLEFLGIEDIELSWIKDFADKESLGLSVYMKIIGAKEETISVVYKKPKYISRKVENDKLNQDIRFDLFRDFVAEYNFCERRFLYSYLLGSHSYFNEDFNQKFIYGEIAKLLRSETASDEDTLQILKSIFPQWDDTFKVLNGLQQMEYASKEIDSDLSGGARLDKRRFRMVFPGIKGERLDEINKKNDLLDQNIKTSMIMDTYKNTNTQECFYCPEQWHCPLAVWKVEDDDDK